MSTQTKQHHGKSVKRLREMQQIKQESLANELRLALEESWDQRKVSLLEDKEIIEDSLLQVIAPILNVTPEIIKSFDPESMWSVFGANSTYHDNASVVQNFQCTFNPIDKLVEVYDELLRQKTMLSKLRTN